MVTFGLFGIFLPMLVINISKSKFKLAKQNRTTGLPSKYSVLICFSIDCANEFVLCILQIEDICVYFVCIVDNRHTSQQVTHRPTSGISVNSMRSMTGHIGRNTILNMIYSGTMIYKIYLQKHMEK